MPSGVIWPGVQAGEGDESIRALQRHPLEAVDQSGADDRANAGDRAQAREVLFALGTRLPDRSLHYYPSIIARYDYRPQMLQTRHFRLSVGGEILECRIGLPKI